MIQTDKLIICVAPCGSYPKGGVHPKMPVTPEEIAEEVYHAWNEGASIADLHAQTPDGKPSTDAEIYKEIVRCIRDRGCDIILEFSPFPGIERADYVEEGFRVIDAQPELLSVGTQVHVFMSGEKEGIIRWTRFFNKRLVSAALKKGIKPDFYVFNVGGIAEVDYLTAKLPIPTPYWIDITLDMQRNLQNATPYSPKNMMHLVEQLPQESMFIACAVHEAETPAAVQAILLGGHTRVGYEDNYWYSKGVLAKSNAQLVARIARIGIDLGRTIASPSEARELLGIPQLKKM